MGILPVLEQNVFFEGPLSGPWYSKHKTQLLGVLLAAASNFLISVSLSIQKCAHLRLACQTEPKPYYTSKLWWCGIILLGLGEVGNFTAYGFAPIALVAPLGCVSVIGTAVISVLFLKQTVRAADILGGTLAVAGTYLLVTFAPNVPQELTARRVQNNLVSWPFLVYVILEIITFCILLYFYKRKAVKHIMILLMMVALLGFSTTFLQIPAWFLTQLKSSDFFFKKLIPFGDSPPIKFPSTENIKRQEDESDTEIQHPPALEEAGTGSQLGDGAPDDELPPFEASLTVIAVKAVASMITLSVKGKMQLTYPVFYIMLILMATSCVFQVKFLNQAMHLYEATAVVPINFMLFTTSAIVSGVIFYQEFQSAALLSVFMFLFGCLLSFLGVFVIARNKKEEHLQVPYIDCGRIPGQKLTGKIQPDSYSSCYGTLNNEDDSVKTQS